MLARLCVSLLLSFHSSIAAARAPAPGVSRPPRQTTMLRDAARESGPTEAPQGAVAAERLAPDLTPPAMEKDWEAEHRWLQAGTGVTWTLVGLGIVGMVIPLSMLSSCNLADRRAEGALDCSPERRVAAVTTPIIGVLTLASLVPAVLFTRRLINHNHRRHETARFRWTAGGLMLRF